MWIIPFINLIGIVSIVGIVSDKVSNNLFTIVVIMRHYIIIIIIIMSFWNSIDRNAAYKRCRKETYK